MAYIDNFEGLFKSSDELTAEKIILKFFDKEFISMKTEIPEKIMMDVIALENLAIVLKKWKLINLAELCDNIVDVLKTDMVSKNREGRHEGERMLGALREQLKTKGIMSKLLGAE